MLTPGLPIDPESPTHWSLKCSAVTSCTLTIMTYCIVLIFILLHCCIHNSSTSSCLFNFFSWNSSNCLLEKLATFSVFIVTFQVREQQNLYITVMIINVSLSRQIISSRWMSVKNSRPLQLCLRGLTQKVDNCPLYNQCTAPTGRPSALGWDSCSAGTDWWLRWG